MNIVKNIPKITGSGPFIQPPKFQFFAKSILSLQLSSNSLINLNPSSSNFILQSNSTKLINKRKLLSLGSKIPPLIFDEIKSNEGCNLLFQNYNGNNHFINLEISNQSSSSSSINVKRNNLFGWYGELKISQFDDKDQYLKISNVEGQSNIILNSSNQLFTVKLIDKSDIISIKTNQLIAYNGLNTKEYLNPFKNSTLIDKFLNLFDSNNKFVIKYNNWINPLIKQEYRTFKGPAIVIFN
ncbi:hypothetical protein WICMUC_000429 [Wickerhamomyces mucosus]|uniref:Altered inheritance of mitochondria protein 24, mitochondrial n=1 Tax=Wickerhamomyces mucosus TaxID=1378264 RepID=A0A9P8PXG6_9ASCO|nr:hypothetical protein WICMUC_000429 [Wickerhamomyces mucosus]